MLISLYGSREFLFHLHKRYLFSKQNVQRASVTLTGERNSAHLGNVSLLQIATCLLSFLEYAGTIC